MSNVVYLADRAAFRWNRKCKELLETPPKTEAELQLIRAAWRFLDRSWRPPQDPDAA